MSRARNLSKFKPGSTGLIADNTITNAMINSSAAIAKTKLASLDIVNADINSSAAIATSKVASYALPIVFAYTTVAQALTATTWTDVTIGTQVIDTHNIFASSVTTLPTGKYLMSATVDLECSSHNNLSAQYIRFTQDTSAVSGSEVDQYMNHTGNNFTSTTMHTTIIHNAQSVNTNAMRVQTWANWGVGNVSIKRVQLSVQGIIV
mgnify:CR=1 FL=1